MSMSIGGNKRVVIICGGTGAARLPGIWSDCRVRRRPYSSHEGLKTPSDAAHVSG